MQTYWAYSEARSRNLLFAPGIANRTPDLVVRSGGQGSKHIGHADCGQFHESSLEVSHRPQLAPSHVVAASVESDACKSKLEAVRH